MVPSIDVVVPSYRRAADLGRCIAALQAQTVVPRSVVVVARRDDEETRATVAAAGWERLRLAHVSVPGMIAAMQCGAAVTSGDVLAFTDDDAAPRPDWVERLLSAFADEAVGAVGGRDALPDERGTRTSDVGRLRWYGRLTGNQHLGEGTPRPVDCLKGVNMAFRSEVLAFARPGLLRGAGAQPHNEPIMCRYVQKRGLRVVYDPQLVVDHFPAVRQSGDDRGNQDRRFITDAAHNLLVSVCALDRLRIPRQLLYAILVGGGAFPGLVRLAQAIGQRDARVARRWLPAVEGAVLGLRTLATTPPEDAVVTAHALRAGSTRALDRAHELRPA